MSKLDRRKAARSGTSPCPICHLARALVEHHIDGRVGPDSEKPWNKAYICPSCHDDVHAGKIVLEGWVYSTEGKILAWHRAGEEPSYRDGINAPLYKKN